MDEIAAGPARESWQQLLLAAHPLDAPGRLDRDDDALHADVLVARLAVHERRERDARRRVAQRRDQRARGDLHAARPAGDHEHEVEPDARHAATP